MAAPTGLGISGFWGLILEPGKRYSKLVDVPFHITAAVLDTLSSGPKKEDDTVSVMLEVDGMEIIICNLSRKLGILQFPLNLRFEEGSRIAFYSTGTGTNIHLSGNILGSKGDFSSFAAKVSDKFTQNKRKNDAEDAKSTKKAKKIPDMPAHQKMRQILNSIDIDDEADGYDSEDEETESDLSEEEEEEEEDEEESEEELTPKIEQVQKTPASKAVNELPKKKKKKKDKIKQEVVATTPSKESVTKTPGQKTPAKTPNAEVSAKTPSKVNTPNNKAGSMNGKSPKQKTPEAKNVAAPSQNKSPKVVKMGGVTCEDLRVGTGTEAVLGKNVNVYYEGRLANNNKMFDSCTSGKPFKFRLGTEDIIKGWNIAISGMKVGGRRKFVCPPHLAYGKRGAPPDIPPHSALQFVVELKAVG